MIECHFDPLLVTLLQTITLGKLQYWNLYREKPESLFICEGSLEKQSCTTKLQIVVVSTIVSILDYSNRHKHKPTMIECLGDTIANNYTGKTKVRKP